MEDLYLERPSFKHKEQYESMMNGKHMGEG